jgi:hypothetical protein
MRYPKLISALLLTLGISACSDDSSPSREITITEPAPGSVRVIHASADAPKVDILANGAILNNLAGVDYQMSSGLFDVTRGLYDIGIEANTPSGNVEVLARTIAINSDKKHNIIALGSVAGGTLDFITITADEMMVASDEVAVQIVHAAPEVPAVDIYVTAPNADLSAAQPLATAAYRDNTGVVEVASGDYQVRITLAGTLTVAYDSGTISLPGGEDIVIAAVPSIIPGSAPVQLLAATSSGTLMLNDINTQAAIRAIHAVADAPAVDIIANNTLTLFDAAPFLGVTDYANVAPATYLLDIAADADNSVVVVDDASVMLDAGQYYTAIAHNTLADVRVDVQMDMPRRIATEAQVRIVHASPSAGSVDIYVTATNDLAGASPAFTDVPYSTDGDLAETGYVSLAPGDYVVTITPAGSTDIALQTGTLSLMGGGIYTALAVDATNGGAPVQLILGDDFAM